MPSRPAMSVCCGVPPSGLARGRAPPTCRIAPKPGGHGAPMPRNICGPQTKPPMDKPLTLLIDRIKTPIGELGIVADESGRLRAVEWCDHDDRMHQSLRLHYGRDGYV